MSAQPGFSRCARDSVLRRDRGPKSRSKVHLRWRTGDWTALLPVLNEKFSSTSLPRQIRLIILGEYATPVRAVRERHPCGDITDRQSATVARKGEVGGTANFLGARQRPVSPRRMSTVIFAEFAHTDRATRPDMCATGYVVERERLRARGKVHYRTTGEGGQPGGRCRAFSCCTQAKHFYRDTI